MPVQRLEVLLIEDNADHAALIRRHLSSLEKRPLHLHWREQLQAGLDRLGQGGIDAVLLDLNLPGSRFSDTLPRVLDVASGVPVIVLTALDDLDVAASAVQRGAQDYLVKAQISGELLVRAVRYAVERKRIEAELKNFNETLERRVVERTELLALLRDVAVAANQADGVEQALDFVLRRVTQSGLWKIGHAFLPVEEGAQTFELRVTSYPQDSARFAPFQQVSLQQQWSADEGLPGQAIASGEPRWTTDLSEDLLPHRAEISREVGLETALVLPVLLRHQTVAVLEFLTDERLDLDQRTVDLLTSIGAQLSHVIQRKTAEQQLYESNERFRLVVDGVQDYAIFMLDASGKVASWNAAARRVLGYKSREILNVPFHRFYLPDGIAAGWPEKHLRTAAEKGRVEDEGWLVRCDGSRFWANVMLTALYDERGKLRGFANVTRDITERKRLEKEVTDVAVEEQQRIGQDLHDGLGQELTGLGCLAESLRAGLRNAHPAQAATAAELVAGICRALGQVRMLAKGLVPVEIDADGLRAALDELARATENWHEIRCQFDCPQPVPVEDNNSATQLYRIAQEAVTNAVKHGKPTAIAIQLNSQRGLLRLAVSDNGRGIATNGEAIQGSGLRIMRYRASVIGATLDIRPAEGGGTLVLCTLKQDQPHEYDQRQLVS